MKTLESSPQMEKCKYPLQKLCHKKFKAKLYCVYDKSATQKGEVFPSQFFLKVMDFDSICNVTSVLKGKLTEVSLDKGSIKWQDKLKLTGSEIDTDTIRQNPYPFYPAHSLVKNLNVYAMFAGFDAVGQAVWEIELS